MTTGPEYGQRIVIAVEALPFPGHIVGRNHVQLLAGHLVEGVALDVASLGGKADHEGLDGQGGNFWGFFACFLALFALTGLGNGSTFMQVPVIFLNMHQKFAQQGLVSEEQARLDATKEGAAVIGFTAAFAAYGGFFIPKSYGTSIDLTGSVNAALIGFILFYVLCLALNWWYYARKNAEAKC